MLCQKCQKESKCLYKKKFCWRCNKQIEHDEALEQHLNGMWASNSWKTYKYSSQDIDARLNDDTWHDWFEKKSVINSRPVRFKPQKEDNLEFI